MEGERGKEVPFVLSLQILAIISLGGLLIPKLVIKTLLAVAASWLLVPWHRSLGTAAFWLPHKTCISMSFKYYSMALTFQEHYVPEEAQILSLHNFHCKSLCNPTLKGKNLLKDIYFPASVIKIMF